MYPRKPGPYLAFSLGGVPLQLLTTLNNIYPVQTSNDADSSDKFISFLYTDVEAAELLVTRNIFSSQWEDSDVVFVVEETKFHVHRVLLSLMSPVFKAMFNSSFREKGQTEIPLPGKEANVFLSFLLIVYSKEDFNEIKRE